MIISHGHKDHGGGLKDFFKINSKAKIYINRHAFGPYYTNKEKNINKYIGLDVQLKDNDRIIFTDEKYKIDDDLIIFSNVKRKHLISSSNKSLLKRDGEEYCQDDFLHDQNLIIKEKGRYVLISGCSHCGMSNIIDEGEKIIKDNIDIAIGGMHLYNPSTNTS